MYNYYVIWVTDFPGKESATTIVFLNNEDDAPTFPHIIWDRIMISGSFSKKCIKTAQIF